MAFEYGDNNCTKEQKLCFQREALGTWREPWNIKEEVSHSELLPPESALKALEQQGQWVQPLLYPPSFQERTESQYPPVAGSVHTHKVTIVGCRWFGFQGF